MKQPNLPGVPVSPSANAITALLLIKIPQRWPEARVWRRNVGVGIGMDMVKKAVGMLLAGQVQAAISLLRSRPIVFGMPGEGDIDGILGPCGRRICIEVKAGRDTLKPNQKTFGAMVENRGGIWVVAHSVEQAMADLERAASSGGEK